MGVTVEFVKGFYGLPCQDITSIPCPHEDPIPIEGLMVGFSDHTQKYFLRYKSDKRNQRYRVPYKGDKENPSVKLSS